jgi:hypothetical protein
MHSTVGGKNMTQPGLENGVTELAARLLVAMAGNHDNFIAPPSARILAAQAFMIAEVFYEVREQRNNPPAKIRRA